MIIFRVHKIIERLNKMLDNAIDGKPIENGFDESKMSALETKFAKYLAMTQTSNKQLTEEKLKIHEMISDISHQTKTPITNILLYAQLLQEENLSENQLEYVNALTSQTDKLNFLISSLIKASRLENGIISICPKYQPLNPMLKDIISQTKQKAEQKNIILNVKNTEVSAYFDLKWTSEAIFNIVDNAIKYTNFNGNIMIHTTVYQMFCKIDIIDNGIGIEENEHSKIFTRFYRSSKVNDKNGVGIGLYIAREIILKQGGYIKLLSKPNVGSTFSVFLPLKN